MIGTLNMGAMTGKRNEIVELTKQQAIGVLFVCAGNDIEVAESE